MNLFIVSLIGFIHISLLTHQNVNAIFSVSFIIVKSFPRHILILAQPPIDFMSHYYSSVNVTIHQCHVSMSSLVLAVTDAIFAHVVEPSSKIQEERSCFRKPSCYAVSLEKKSLFHCWGEPM